MLVGDCTSHCKEHCKEHLKNKKVTCVPLHTVDYLWQSNDSINGDELIDLNHTLGDVGIGRCHDHLKA